MPSFRVPRGGGDPAGDLVAAITDLESKFRVVQVVDVADSWVLLAEKKPATTKSTPRARKPGPTETRVSGPVETR